MASLPQKIDDRPKFPSTTPVTPHFLKVIREETSRHSKLRIPKKFMRKYGKNLSKSACLTLPSGSKWEVKVTKRNGEVWFEKGWPEFSEFYSLGYGHRLVLGYEGSSEFKVCIFDRSNMEIDYPVADDEEIKDNDEAKTRQKSPSPCPRAHKKNRTGGKTVRSRGAIDQVERKGSRTVKVETDCTMNCGLDMSSCAGDPSPAKKCNGLPMARRGQKPVTETARVDSISSHTYLGKRKMSETGGKVTQRASSLKFLVAANKLSNAHVHVPAGVSKQKKQSSTLPYRGTRPYGLIVEKSMKNTDSHRSKLEIKGEDDSPARKVDIPPNPKAGKAKALERANAFKSENPLFKLVMQPSYIRKAYAWFPSNFVKTHLINKSGNVILRTSNGRTWSVELKYDKARAKFHYGWREFWQDNNLEVGDICVFELVNKIRLQFDVVFFRTKEAANCTLAPGNSQGRINLNREIKREVGV